ncbi:MAG: SCO family protein [Brumimicrobium sp.]|nr:SCO family protein [Brumimicrobium sp.]
MEKKENKGGKKKSILMILLAFGPAILLFLVSLGKCSNNYQQLPVFSEIPSYKFIGANGKEITEKTQAGYITIFTTIQVSCPTSCAIDLFKFNMGLYQEYRKDQKEFKDVKILSIVTDEQGNPVDNIDEIIYTLSDMVVGYDSTIWNLVTGDPAQVYNVENDKGVNLYMQENQEAFAQKPYLSVLLLADKKNQLRYVGLGNQEGYIRDFKQHIALLRQEYKKQNEKK